MKGFFASSLSLLAALSAVGQSMAQTPAGFNPGSNKVLPAKVADITLSGGTYVPLDRIVGPPTVSLTDFTTNGSYLLFLLDLDAPAVTNNSFSPLVHWLVALPAGTTSISPAQINASIVPYFPVSPPPGTGRHRYTLLLLSNPQSTFAWPAGVKAIDPTVVTDRFTYDVAALVKAGGYTPLAGNYFTTDNTTTTYVVVAGATGLAGTVPSAALGVACLVVLMLAYL